jgi:hypothetical protein
MHNIAPSHVRITSGPPGTTMGHSTSAYSISSQNVTTPTTVASPTPTTAAADTASPARSARSKGYAIFDTDLASLGGPKGLGLSTKKGIPAIKDVNLNPSTSNPNQGGANLVPARPSFSPFDSDTLPISIPNRGSNNYALSPDNSKYSPVASTKLGVLPDMLSFGLGMDSPMAGTFSPPPSALLPSTLFSEDGHRWDGDAASPPFANGSSPVQLINENGASPGQFGNGQWANSTGPGQYRNGTSPARWEKDADGWVTEAKPALNAWESKPSAGNGWDDKHPNGYTATKDVNQARDGWIGDSDSWIGESNGGWMSEGRRRWTNESPATAGVWVPRTEGRPRSVSAESRFERPGLPHSESYDAHRLSTGADSGYHTATNHSIVGAPKKRNSGSSSGDDAAQDVSVTSPFAPPFIQHSPVSGSIDAPFSSFGSGALGPPSHLSNRRGYEAQRVSLPARVPLIREVDEPEHAPIAESTVSVSPAKGRRWFSSVGTAKKDNEASARVQKSELNPDAKAFSFSPDTSKIFNFTRGRTFNLAPPATAPAPVEPPTTFSPFGLGDSANLSTPALGNGSVSSGSGGTFFSSLLAFAPSPAEREALQRALGTNGLTRTLSNPSARSPFTSPLPSARSSAVDLSDKAALVWNESSTPAVQKRMWFPVRKKAAVEETE